VNHNCRAAASLIDFLTWVIISFVEVAPIRSGVSAKREAAEAGGDEERPNAKRMKPTQNETIEYETGDEVLAERKTGVWEEGKLLGPSAKQAGAWKVKFQSDGKVFARQESQLKTVAGEDEEDDGDDSDASLEMEDA
jgi:hypothetical protein